MGWMEPIFLSLLLGVPFPATLTAMIDAATRALALQAFRDVLTNPDSKPADRLRAAEGVMRLEMDEKEQGKESDLDASDAELLEMARGKGKKTKKDDLEAFVRGE